MSAFVDAVRALRADHPEPPSRYRLPLTVNTFEDAELAAALEVLVKGRITMGPHTRAFEAAFAKSQGAADAVYVNSGSSANLLALALLAYADGVNPGADAPVLQPGDEVVVPAVTWSTTVWPVSQVGAVPVLADVSPETLNLTVESVERALSPRTKAVFAVHLLGNPAPVDGLAELCRERGLVLIEDTCEALDTELGGKKAGTFGRLGTFSFYFSHHICTIEGGMVLCRDPGDADRLRSLRGHGWTRHLSPERREAIERRNPKIDPRFLFVERGFNLRPTDVQAAIGLVQLERRGQFLARRREVGRAWGAARDRHPEVFLPLRIAAGSSHFAFPLVLQPEAPVERARLFTFLDEHGIETRPLVAGNLAAQPAVTSTPHRVAGPLDGAQLLHERAMYIGIHPQLSDAQVAALPETLEAFAREVNS